MFDAFPRIEQKEWEITYEETAFDGAEATRLWNAQVHPYCEEIYLELKNIFREHGLECKESPVINGHVFALEEYDLRNR
jgi:hypothetical protein